MIQNKNLLGNRIVTEVTNLKWGNFPGGSDGKESACNEGDSGLTPGSGRSPGEGTNSSILAWKIPWTEEPGRLQSVGSQTVRHT